MRFAALLPLVMLAAAAPAAGASTDWQELEPGTRVRLIASETRTSAGTTFVAIELDMPPNTKTYWRVPGESGIATELDFTGSTGISGSRLHWPYPQVERKDGYTDFVYYGPVVIPAELEVDGDRPVIEASLLMGVCSDICIPATATFSLPLDLTRPDPGQDLRIAQALALTPIPWDGAGEPIGDIGFDPATDALRVEVDSALVDPASVLADASEAGYLFGAPQKSPEAGIVLLPLLGGKTGKGAGAVPVHIVFMTSAGAYEVSRQVAASAAAH